MEKTERPWLKYYDWHCPNGTINYPDISLYEFVRRAAVRHPNVIAYEFQGKSTKYSRFISKVDHIAACLQKMGVKKGDKVLVCMPNSPQAVDMFYAISKLGAVSVMIHPLSAKNEIKHYIENSGSKIALTLDAFCKKFLEVKDETPLEKLIITSIKNELGPIMKIGFALTLGRKIPPVPKDDCIIMWKEFLKLTDDDNIEVVENVGKDPAVILYSGGTTGKSKGMLLSNLNVNATAMGTIGASSCLPMPVEDMYTDKSIEILNKRQYIVLSVMPLFHGFGLGVGIHSFLTLGGTCVLVPNFTPESYAKLIMKKKPNYIAGVPTLFEKMISLDIMKNADMSSLEGVFSGGDSLPTETRRKFNEFMKTHNGKTMIREGYGLTECVTVSCLTPINEFREGSIGVPLPDILYKIVERGTHNELPYGEIGEICITGPDIMIGYVGDEEETKKALQVHDDGRTWLHTGDAGYMDADGFIYFKQRYKRIIISSGYNIYPSQIEDAINKYPGVKSSCAIGVPDPIRQERVKVYLVLEDGVVGDEKFLEGLKAHCKEYIAGYAVPKLFDFLDEMPMTKVGKIAYTEVEEIDRKKREAKN